MAKNSSVPWHVAPLQRVVAEEITDPGEQAALDELRRRVRQTGTPLSPEDATAAAACPAVSRVLELTQRLSAAERRALLARLAERLPEAQQFELLERVLAKTAPEALDALEEELSARVGP